MTGPGWAETKQQRMLWLRAQYPRVSRVPWEAGQSNLGGSSLKLAAGELPGPSLGYGFDAFFMIAGLLQEKLSAAFYVGGCFYRGSQVTSNLFANRNNCKRRVFGDFCCQLYGLGPKVFGAAHDIRKTPIESRLAINPSTREKQ